MNQLLHHALSGENGHDQYRIAKEGITWVETLLAKNSDYGSSVFDVPILAPECDAGTAIRVRMSDKIQRILTLLEKEPEVASESLEDTVRDLGAYCLLWLVRPKGTNQE